MSQTTRERIDRRVDHGLQAPSSSDDNMVKIGSVRELPRSQVAVTPTLKLFLVSERHRLATSGWALSAIGEHHVVGCTSELSITSTAPVDHLCSQGRKLWKLRHRLRVANGTTMDPQLTHAAQPKESDTHMFVDPPAQDLDESRPLSDSNASDWGALQRMLYLKCGVLITIARGFIWEL